MMCRFESSHNLDIRKMVLWLSTELFLPAWHYPGPMVPRRPGVDRNILCELSEVVGCNYSTLYS